MLMLEGTTRFILELLRSEPPVAHIIGHGWSLSMVLGVLLAAGGRGDVVCLLARLAREIARCFLCTAIYSRTGFDACGKRLSHHLIVKLVFPAIAPRISPANIRERRGSTLRIIDLAAKFRHIPLGLVR